MMCEECGVNPAVFHFVTIRNDERTERNLCPACMAKYKKQLPGIDIKNLAGILNNLIDGKKGAGKEEVDPETESITCEQCGMTYGEFRKCGMLGCAACYDAFREPMTAQSVKLWSKRAAPARFFLLPLAKCRNWRYNSQRWSKHRRRRRSTG